MRTKLRFLAFIAGIALTTSAGSAAAQRVVYRDYATRDYDRVRYDAETRIERHRERAAERSTRVRERAQERAFATRERAVEREVQRADRAMRVRERREATRAIRERVYYRRW